MENMTVTNHDVILAIINDITRMQQNLEYMDDSVKGVSQLKNRIKSIYATLNSNQAEPKAIPPTGHRAQLVRPIRGVQRSLVADVPHAEEHGGNEGDDDHDHGAFQIDGVTNVAAALGDPIGREGKSFEGLKSALKPCEFSALHKVRLDFVNKTT